MPPVLVGRGNVLLEEGSSTPTQTQHKHKILSIFFQGTSKQKDISVPVRGGRDSECLLYQPSLCVVGDRDGLPTLSD